MKDWVKEEIKKYVRESKDNWFEEINDHYYGEPVIRFASTEDPLFKEYKNIIGEEHFTPGEAFELTFGEGSYHGGTVISVVLPITEKIRRSNAKQSSQASREWALLRSFGDDFFKNKLYGYVEKLLNEKGYKTVAPAIQEWFKIIRTPQGIISNWSERHIAYVAGQGTFSLNDGFISDKGIAVRVMSFVTELQLTPDIRPYKNYAENCLFCSNGTCGACIKRCPAGALSESGHDKMKCFQFVYGEESKRLAAAYGGNYDRGSGCGLCQTKVPCESKNPIDK